MTTAANYSAVVQELYVSYFGRPADPTGLQNFEAALAALNAPTDITNLTLAYSTDSSIKELIDAFGTSTESAALYGTVTSNPASVTVFVNAVFENLFDRPAQAAGLSFWVNAITSGQLSLGNVALNIAAGAAANATAQGLQDAVAVQNKVAVAADFTAELTTPAEIAAYSGAAAAASARTLIAGVSDATVQGAYQTEVALAVTAIIAGTPYSPPVVTPPVVTPPVVDNTYELTSGIDTFVGGSGNNVFNAILDNAAGLTAGGAVATLNASDSLTGGSQVNVLNIADFGLGSTMSIPGSASIVGMTSVHVDSTESVSQDFSTWAGLNNIVINTSIGPDMIAAAATTAVTVHDAGLASGSTTITGGSTIHATVGGVTSGGAVAIGSAATSAQITATISDANTGGSATGSTITVTGGTVVNLTQTIAAAGSVIGSANTATGGAIVVNGGVATTSVSITQSAPSAPLAGVAASNGVTESAVVTWVGFTALPGTETAGDLTIGSDGMAAHTAAEVATVAAGGSVAGLSIVSPSIFWSIAPAVGASNIFTCNVANANEPDITVSGTGSAALPAPAPIVTQGSGIVQGVAPIGGVADGTVTITDLNSANTDGTQTNSISSVILDAYGVAAINTNALANLSLADSAAAVTVTDNSAVPASTTLHLKINNLGAGAALDDSAITTLDIATGPAASFLAVNAGAVTTEAISGTSTLSQTASGMMHLTTITVSGAAGFADSDLAGIGSLASVTSTSSGAISVTLNATQTSFTGGAGQDVVTIGAAATHAITGGSASNNELVWGAAAPAGGLGSVTGFTTLGTNASTSGTFDMSQFPAFTALAVHGAGGNVVFSNVTAGTPLRIDADTLSAVTVQNADSNGAADSITLRLGTATTPELGLDQLTLEDHVGAGIGTVNMISNASSDFSSNIIGTLTDANLVTLNLSGNCAVYVASDIADVAHSVTFNNAAGSHTSSFVSLTDNFLTTLTFQGSEQTYIYDVISSTPVLTITNSDTSGVAIHGITDAALTTAIFTNTIAAPAGIAYVEYLDGTALASLTLNGNVQTSISADMVSTGITVAGATDNAQVSFVSTGATAAGQTDSVVLGNGDDTVVLGAGVATSMHTVTLGTGSNTVIDSTVAGTSITVTGNATAIENIHADAASSVTIVVGIDLGSTISALAAHIAHITAGAGANSVISNGTAAALTFSVGNGSNNITASGDGDTGSIAVGSGANTINLTGGLNTAVNIALMAHTAPDGIALGANASASEFSSITGILSGDTIRFADAASGAAVAITATQVDSDAAVVTALGSSAQLASWITTAIDQTSTHGVAWFVFSGDTYLVENAGGAGVNDTSFAGETVVKLVGIHNEAAAMAAAHIFTVV